MKVLFIILAIALPVVLISSYWADEKLKAWKQALPGLSEDELWAEYKGVVELYRTQNIDFDTREKLEALREEFKARGLSADFSYLQPKKL